MKDSKVSMRRPAARGGITILGFTRRTAIGCLLLFGVLSGPRPPISAAPAVGVAGDVMICFTVNSNPPAVRQAGTVKFSAKKAGKTDISANIPIAQNANMAAVLGAITFYIPTAGDNGWKPEDFNVAGNCVSFKGVTEVDFDAGTTEIKITPSASPGVLVNGVPAKVKIRGAKNGIVGRNGWVELIGAGTVAGDDGGVKVRYADEYVMFSELDDMPAIFARIATRLVLAGWSVTYAVGTSEIVINAMPDGLAPRTVTFSVVYGSGGEDADYHWFIEFAE